MHAPNLWKLEAVGPRDLLNHAADLVSEVDPPWALAVSLFDHDAEHRRLELLFDGMPDVAAVRRAVALEDPSVHIVFGPIPEEDWLAMSFKNFPAVHAGRFRLYGSHDRAKRGGLVNLLIDAGEAFGTGHHGTTKGCLLALSDLLKRARPQSVLDVGAGTGALAIAAAKAVGAHALATDIDEDAVRTARDNVRDNQAVGRVRVIEADGLADPRIAAQRYDLVFANILAGPLVWLAKDIVAATARGGHVILSGLMTEQERGVAPAYADRGLIRERRLILDGWATLVFRKP